MLCGDVDKNSCFSTIRMTQETDYPGLLAILFAEEGNFKFPSDSAADDSRVREDSRCQRSTGQETTNDTATLSTTFKNYL